MKREFLSLVFTGLACFGLHAQISFQKMVGTDSGDEASAVLQTTDSGYIATGVTYVPNSTRKGYLVKFDKWGNQLWSKILGEDGETVCKSISGTRDGGFIIGGYFSKEGTTYPLLIKTDAEGNQQWSKTYGGKSGNTYGYSAQQTADGGYIICGSKFNSNAGDVYIAKTDTAGTLVWEKTYGGSSYEAGFSIDETKDGGFVVAGQTTGFGHSKGGIYLLKVNDGGTEQWVKTFGGKSINMAYCVRQTTDGGYVIAGDVGSEYSDVYLLKTDSKGNKLWGKSFGGTRDDHARSIEETADGGYIIGGYTNSFKPKATDRDFYLIKTDNTGTEQWHKLYGGTGEDNGISCKPALDGGYIFAGYSDTERFGWNDIMLVKTDAEGK